MAAACCGFLLADVILVGIVGSGSVRMVYRRHELWIVRGSGLLFLGFAAAALSGAIPGLWANFAA
jgi:hypothetical protein